jgi:hypothetical protein
MARKVKSTDAAAVIRDAIVAAEIAQGYTQQATKAIGESIGRQEDALQIIEQQPPSSAVVVGPGDSLESVLAGLSGGETVVVSGEVRTVCDLVIAKPVTLSLAAVTGTIDVQVPDVKLLGCSVVGNQPNSALVATGDRLEMRGCRLVGSLQGQHRGVWVRSQDVKILDSDITNIQKGDGQETQAIAGWSGVKRLLVRGCVLEAASVNLHIGGTDPASESDIPEDVTVVQNYFYKRQQWWGWSNVKNLFELKNVKKALVEGNRFEFAWVEGQAGYAIVLNVRNQEGGAPYSTIEDVTIRNNSIQYTAGGVNLLGRDYTHPSQTMKRVLIEGNVFEHIEPRWGANQRCILMAHGGEDVTIRGNQFSGSEINSFLTFDAEPWVNFCFEDNTVPEGYYGIKSDDCALGTPTLEKYAPGYVWNGNTVVRSVAANTIPYPPGTTIHHAE